MEINFTGKYQKYFRMIFANFSNDFDFFWLPSSRSPHYNAVASGMPSLHCNWLGEIPPLVPAADFADMLLLCRVVGIAAVAEQHGSCLPPFRSEMAKPRRLPTVPFVLLAAFAPESINQWHINTSITPFPNDLYYPNLIVDCVQSFLQNIC